MNHVVINTAPLFCLTRNEEMWHFVFFSLLIPLSRALSRTDVMGSSFFETNTDFALFGHAISNHVTKGLASCSHLCLSNGECISFNFRRTGEHWGEGLCELNNDSCWANKKLSLSPEHGNVYGEFIDFQINQYVFTNLGAKGPNGPTKSQLSGYHGTSLEGQISIDNGIQYWTVPFCGSYVIEALGASGSNGTSQSNTNWRLGGLGARIKGTFYFNKGTTLKILVGQRGITTKTFIQRPGGGGGGTFVTLKDNTNIIIAGGGGGGGLAEPHYQDGDPGQAIENGTKHGGYDGLGGFRYQTEDKKFVSSDIKASSGAGYSGDGNSETPGTEAKSFLHGGRGGMHFVKNGGFGGGGYGMTHGGGGGGYSGGGVTGTKTSGVSGGGGSYNSGSFQVNEAGVNEGDGKVIITLML